MQCIGALHQVLPVHTWSYLVRAAEAAEPCEDVTYINAIFKFKVPSMTTSSNMVMINSPTGGKFSFLDQVVPSCEHPSCEPRHILKELSPEVRK